MKNIKIYILAIIALFTSFSCEKALDINTDPLAATSADPNVVLPYVLVQYSNRKSTELGTRTLDVSQHHSFNFNSPRNGNTSIFLTGNTWFMMYAQVLGNLALVEADAKAAGETNNNIAAIAVILKGMVYYELSSIWEDVPFTQAVQPAEFPAPDFDDQPTVLAGAVAYFDEAMALIDAMPADGNVDVSTGDIMYRGDMTSWRKLANSLKIRVLMLLRSGGQNVDSDLVAAFGQPIIDDNADVAMIRYEGVPGAINAFQNLNEAFFGTSNEVTRVYGPGPPLYALVSGGNHPMGDIILDDVNAPAPTYGLRPSATEAKISDDVIRRDLPDVWFTPAELSLYRAELVLDGVAGLVGSAKQNYDEGVTHLLEWWGGDIPGATATLDAATISAYVASLPATPTLADIQDQLYLDTFMRPVVAWNHVRRATSPVLNPPSTSQITTILKRFNYPPDEVAANPKTPANPLTDVPMWFEGI